MYLNSIGTSVNKEKTKQLFKLAAERGFTPAKKLWVNVKITFP